jgi:hypothetical protein
MSRTDTPDATLAVKCPYCGMMVLALPVDSVTVRMWSHYYGFLSSLGGCQGGGKTVSRPMEQNDEH